MGNILGNVAGAIWGDGTDGGQREAMQKLEAKLQEYQLGVETIARIFADSERTEFVCVCIAEHLSVFETLRLVEELKEAKIATRRIICNQLVPRQLSGVQLGDADKVASILQQYGGLDASVGEAVKEACELMGARARIQKSYLSDLIKSLPTHTVVPMPLLPTEVRGVKHLRVFSELLVKPDHRLTGKEADGNPLAGLSLMAEGSYTTNTDAKFLSNVEVVEVDSTLEDYDIGAAVKVHSLRGKPEYNGLNGTVVGKSNGRIEVRVRLSTKKMRKLALKPENVEIVENSDTPTSAPETAPALTLK